ncbi:uncharacterized protein I303_105853 [Kwoniella dejecticola CBS 10117]|uniref:Uncharacterized protein n=1 Tax=Kwoniella dejecticola CBS 10117 TaxID=1296121 RepID=A0A1A6A0K1_9TREE|nr:uncharacterized protein I303_05874 [Kwoniella dejecticola CBS 10117]OBR83594.1 hypothetical protein I303_05874 [Kwoniella dejecticola CBS 10117]
MSFSALVAMTGFIFMIWHTWHYDRWKCLLYSKDDWFRAVMCHILLGSIACLMVFTWIDVHVLYAEYYIYLPQTQQTIVAPWQLWTELHQKLYRISLYFMTAGWGFLQAIHLEEFLYWGYLIKSIKTPGGPRSTWLKSGFFKVWIYLFFSSFALLIGSVHIETDNLDMMRAYLFVVGSSMSTLLALASGILCFIFPSFLRTVKQQGASFEVLERLHFFSEMNQIRTFCRVAYSAAILVLSVDGLTKSKTINKSPFWHDVLYLIGQLALFAATCLSIVVLLPRNMTSESLPPPSKDTTFLPMAPYNPGPKSPRGRTLNADGTYPIKQFFELGERLNVGPDALGGINSGYPHSPHPHPHGVGRNHQGEKYEMSKLPEGSSSNSKSSEMESAPFTEVMDRTKKARLSEFPTLPNVVSKFKSPFETAQPKTKGPTQVLVTSHTVVEEN